jgi:TolB-like protein/Tfp pilus assembly protein PilF
MTLPAGTRLGPYEILSPLGAGGMGEVYRARDPRLRRDVALKVLPDELADDAERLARFEREARAASALNHPNIITIYEIGRERGISYIAMELVDGETLRSILFPGPLEAARIAELGGQIADGLAKAHAAGIVHRDLKPENLMVSSDGFVKILDFGIARHTPLASEGSQGATLTGHTTPGTVLGTVGYMSPEQATGRPVDHRSDQFALGAILYEMATGLVAFHRTSPIETLLAIVHDEPKPASEIRPAVPKRLSAIIARCLKKAPEERYADTREISREVRAVSAGGPELPAPLLRPRRAWPRAATWALAGAALAAVVLLLLPSRAARIDSLAVLPFETPAADPEAEYLGQGIADSLIENLSRVPDLRVIASSSVARYKGRPIDPEKIGKELGVDAVLIGRVAQHGDQLNVTAELADARRNAHVWGQQYDRRFSEIMGVQQDIASRVAEALRPKRAPEKGGRSAGSTTDTDAYRLYLKGRYHWNKRTDVDLRKSIAYFQEAIDKDPAYADAYAGLADTMTALGWYEFSPPTEIYPRAKAAATRAIEIDPASKEAYASLGGIEVWFDWDWATAQKHFERMLELNPNYPTGRHWHADLLSIQGRHEEAIAESKKALELDPLSLIINAWLGRRYYFARRYDEAARECRKTLELDPNFAPGHWILGSVLVAQGNARAALPEFETAVRLSGENPRYLAYLGNAKARAGDAAGARATLERLSAIEAGGHYVSALDRALVYAGLGEKAPALDWIEKAFVDRPSLMPYLHIDPLWDGLRPEPRFQAMLDRLSFGAAPPR